MKKRILFTLVVVFCLLLLEVPAFAANNVTDIEVEVTLYEDGSAYITQTWDCDFTEGTEAYFPLENLGGITLSNFSVSDKYGAYRYLENWDIDAGFAEKAGKCGIVKTARGYELCWGITDYGLNRYAIEYTLGGLVSAYEDYDGFNFQFISSGMGTLPTDATVTIVTQDGTPLNPENCGIWAFGFDGEIYFENGQIFAYTETPLTKDTDSVIVMIQLNKGILSPKRKVTGSFEAVKDRAFEGSDYDNTDTGDSSSNGLFWTIFTAIYFLVPFLIVGFLLWSSLKRRRSYKKLYNSAEYFREVPIAGNLEAVYALARRFNQSNNDGDLIAAIFLKLLSTGSLEPITEKRVGIFGREKERISLRLIAPPEFASVAAVQLYELLILASGSDGILQEKELEKYCSSHYTSMLNVVKEAKADGEKTLAQINSYISKPSANLKSLTERGKDLLLQIMGFKKYLLDFSLIGERGLKESVIWQDYLVFAALLGIADKAISQFKQVYPDVTPYQRNAEYTYLLAYQFQHASYRAAMSASAARSSGSGGHSSSGGGGGFSGGGHGGGTR